MTRLAVERERDVLPFDGDRAPLDARRARPALLFDLERDGGVLSGEMRETDVVDRLRGIGGAALVRQARKRDLWRRWVGAGHQENEQVEEQQRDPHDEYAT